MERFAPSNTAQKVAKKATDSSGLDDQIVELMGIEPTASRVRYRNDASNPNDFADLERQKTSEDAQKRPILAVYRQNSEAVDPVSSQLEDARREWSADRDARRLRKALLVIMGLLDG